MARLWKKGVNVQLAESYAPNNVRFGKHYRLDKKKEEDWIGVTIN